MKTLCPCHRMGELCGIVGTPEGLKQKDLRSSPPFILTSI